MQLKKLTAVISALMIAISMTGCKYDSIDNTETLALPNLPDYSQHIELGEYKNIEYKLSNDYSVSDEYIKYGVETLLYNVASYKNITDRGAKIGDLVTLKYKAYVDGKEMTSLSSKDGGTAIFLGYSNLLDGFEENLIGLKEGDTKTITLVLPNDFNKPNLRGKDIVFNIEIAMIQERIMPEITDKLVAENTQYTSVEEITKAVKDTLSANELYRRNAEIYAIVSEKIVKNATIKSYPEKLVNDLVETTITNVKNNAAINGMSINDYIKDNYDEESLDSYRATITSNVKDFLAIRMVMCEIARKENISATAEEFTEYKKQYAKDNGYMNIKDVNVHYTDEEILLDASLAKIETWLIKNSVEIKN